MCVPSFEYLEDAVLYLLCLLFECYIYVLKEFCIISFSLEKDCHIKSVVNFDKQ